MYTVAKGPTALIQKSRLGTVFWAMWYHQREYLYYIYHILYIFSLGITFCQELEIY